MKRLLLFLSVMFGTALLIFLLVVGLNWQSYKTLFSNQKGLREGSQWIEKTYSLEGLTEYIGQNPFYVSVVSYTLGEPDSGIYYRADVPRSMGALSNIFLLLEYTRRIDKGVLDSTQRVPLSEINKYTLPKIDDGAHEDGLASLRAEGKIQDGSITLQTAAETLAEFNDLAIADYFYFRFGKAPLDSLLNRMELNTTELPLPFSGLYIAMSSVLQQTSPDSLMNRLYAMEQSAFNDYVISLANKYQQDLAFRKTVQKVFRDDGLGLLFTEQRDFQHAIFPKSTARELSSIMKKLREDFFPESVSRQMFGLLSWPLKQPQMRNDFTTYGALYDNRLGILNGIDSGISAYSGETYVQTVMFDNLPVGFWVHMSSNHMHQDYQQRLIWDPALQKATRKAISKHETPR